MIHLSWRIFLTSRISTASLKTVFYLVPEQSNTCKILKLVFFILAAHLLSILNNSITQDSSRFLTAVLGYFDVKIDNDGVIVEFTQNMSLCMPNLKPKYEPVLYCSFSFIFYTFSIMTTLILQTSLYSTMYRSMFCIILFLK